MTQSPHSLDDHFSHVPMANDVNTDDLNCVREWLTTQPHLPFVSDRQISIFLHSCYGEIELTKVTIENYYAKRTDMPDLFGGRKVEPLKSYLQVVYMSRSSCLSIDGYQVMHIGFLDSDSSKYDCLMNARVLFAMLDLYSNEMPYVPGWRLCIDVKYLSFGHYLKLTTSLGVIRRMIYYLQTALPIRLKGIHVRNTNSLVTQFVNILKPFMNKELVELIHLHSASDGTLYEHIPKEGIPNENLDKLVESKDDFLKETSTLLDRYQKWFDDDEKLARVDESRRVRNASNAEKRSSSFFRSLLGRGSE